MLSFIRNKWLTAAHKMLSLYLSSNFRFSFWDYFFGGVYHWAPVNAAYWDPGLNPTLTREWKSRVKLQVQLHQAAHAIQRLLRQCCTYMHKWTIEHNKAMWSTYKCYKVLMSHAIQIGSICNIVFDSTVQIILPDNSNETELRVLPTAHCEYSSFLQ